MVEAGALEAGKDPSPSRRAQRDFLHRYLSPLLRSVADRLRGHPAPTLDGTIKQLVDELPTFAESQAVELEARVGPFRDPNQPGFAKAKTKPVAAGDLWG